MNRRSVLAVASWLPISLLTRRWRPAAAAQANTTAHLQQQAIEINNLASNLHSRNDALQLINQVASLFADQLPSAWTTRSFRNRLAQAEFAANDLKQQIPEHHIANTWNTYARTIHAPGDFQISAVELHNLRDAQFATARLFWTRTYKNIWAIPGIFAVKPDGALAPGCRAIEALRLLWDLANQPDNLLAARQRTRQGILASNLLRQADANPPRSGIGQHQVTARVTTCVTSHPIRDAARQFVQNQGTSAFTNVVQTMLNSVLSPSIHT